ncbi:hypothetical protein QBC43DRAFT_23574 [Cladorrhinum sp. PSN259]|nr:hypothetical protein QBC43DRAFT_23574 [Cladorrhinum sp. PSN259]
MDALLGLGVGKCNPSCGSIADLQGQLRDLLSTRVTESSAQHVTETFEIRSSAVFEIPTTQSGNEALETTPHIDPLLGGVQPSTVPAVGVNGEPVPARRINATDALMVQATDDNVLQKIVAGHIIASLGQVDNSQWIVRQVSRTDQGWTFSYNCKDSQAEWDRQSAKTPAKTAIAEWSEKGGQDPVHLARPAFDCRGSLKISFVKSTRTIDVKYEHAPLHKTVEQLIELLAPPPLAPIVKTPVKKPKTPKQPKEPGPPKEPKAKTPRPRKRPQGENGTPGGEGSQPKKRRKKKDSTAPGSLGGRVLPPEMPGALPVGESSERQLYNTQVGVANHDQPAGSSSYPEGLVGAEEAAAPAVFNLPPGETERRRDVANQFLRDAGIDPATLSVEQFNIFANQSPELQKDSLAMLVKYGAERLRIVHPTKEGASTGESTPQPSPSPAANDTPKPKRSRKKKPEAAVPEEEGAAAPTATSRPVEGKRPPRGICDNCRNNKQPKVFRGPKCDKGRPSCQNCLAQGWECNYSHKQRGPGELNVGEKLHEDAPAPAPAPVPVPDPVVEIIGDGEPEDLGSPGFHTHSVPEHIQEPIHQPVHEPIQEPNHVPDLHSQQIESPSDSFSQVHSIYNHSSDFPQTDTVPEASHSNMPSAGTDSSYISTSIPETPSAVLPDFIYSPQPQQPQVDYQEQTTTSIQSTQHHQPQPQHTSIASPQTRTRRRRSLPTSQPSYLNSTNSTTVNSHNDDWQSMGSSTAAVRTTTSPREVRKKAPVSQAYDDMRQQSSGWATATHPPAQTTQPVQNTSPYQASSQIARAKSRQGNRSQTHTPVNSMSAVRQPPSQPNQTVSNNAGYSTTTAAQSSTSNQGYDYNQQYSTASTGPTARYDSSNDRIAYQPYSNNQPASNTSNSYSSFDNYKAGPANNTSNPVTQNVASSYSATSTAPSTGQWGTASSGSAQARNAHTYNTNQAASANTSYINTSNTQPSTPMQGFSVRPQPPATRSSTVAYGQQSQQHHRQQQHEQQQQQQQHTSYSGYQTQQQPQQQASNNQNWWATSNNPSSTYSSAAAGAAGSGANDAHSGSAGTSHGHTGQQHHQQPQQQQHHHRSTNLSSHQYGWGSA